MDYKELGRAVNQFPITEEVVGIIPIGNGHINDTYAISVNTPEGERRKYVLQRINHQIFEDVETLQSNIFAVTSHVRRHLEQQGVEDVDRKVLTFIKTKDGKNYASVEGNKWRLCYYIKGSKSYESVSPKLAYVAGKAFGEFHSMLSDLPEGQLSETIPNFHNMSFRLQQFRDSVNEDRVGRVAEVQDLIEEIEQRAEAMTVQERLYQNGSLKLRTNHCDTKVNNILFDEATDEVLCVIDLDTVMPGFVLSDIGDFIRTAVNSGEEDDENLSNIQVNMPVFESYIRGYMEEAKAFLTPVEIELLPYGGRLLTYMQTVRFLTDYINGDTYYKTHKPKHNLIRTRAQFEFLLKLEEKQKEMDHFMKSWL